MGFGGRLREARIARNMTQHDLAERLDISVNSIANYERGISFPKEDYLYKIFNYLGFDPNYLFQDDIDVNAGFWFEEMRILDDYRSLNDRGRMYVSAVLNYEVNRNIENQIANGVEIRYAKLDVKESSFGNIVRCKKAETVNIPDAPTNVDFVLKISGNGLNPELYDGDIIFFKHSPDIMKGNWGLFNINGYAVICRKLANALVGLDGKIFRDDFLKGRPVLFGKITEIYKVRAK
jgi:transcriptional regulator with XRE-family HTH domain